MWIFYEWSTLNYSGNSLKCFLLLWNNAQSTCLSSIRLWFLFSKTKYFAFVFVTNKTYLIWNYQGMPVHGCKVHHTCPWCLHHEQLLEMTQHNSVEGLFVLLLRLMEKETKCLKNSHRKSKSSSHYLWLRQRLSLKNPLLPYLRLHQLHNLKND